MQPDALPPPVAVMQMLAGRWVSQALAVAAHFGVADHLEGRPRPIADVAQKVGAHPDALARLLRALASVGVFHEESKGEFCNTPLSSTLRTDAPQSLRGIARFWGMKSSVVAWGSLDYAVATGTSSFEKVHGMRAFDYLEKHQDDAKLFNDAMTSYSAQETAAVNAAFDFSSVKVLADVGGGHGALLASILEKNPSQRGILFDLPSVVKGAKVPPRCEVVGGDFFKDAPKADGYLLKHIIHDWDDAHCKTILDKIHAVSAPGAKVFVIDAVIPPGNGPAFGKLLDLEMLVITHGGRERTEEEFAALAKTSGFELVRVVPTQSPSAVVELVRR